MGTALVFFVIDVNDLEVEDAEILAFIKEAPRTWLGAAGGRELPDPDDEVLDMSFFWVKWPFLCASPHRVLSIMTLHWRHCILG